MSIHIKSLNAFNFAGYSTFMINLNRFVNYLIGPNGAGKTIAGLDIIWFVLQGIAEKSSEGKIPLIGERYRFIGKDGATALAELVLWDDKLKAEIRVIRKLLKHGTELTFSGPIGKELDQAWLNSLFNLFLISPKRFIDLSSREQSVALGIDTKKWDEEIAKLKLKFTEVNKELSKYDNLDEVEMVERPQLEALQTQKQEIKEKLANEVIRLQGLNKVSRDAWNDAKKVIDKRVNQFNGDQADLTRRYNRCYDAVQTLKSEGLEPGFFLSPDQIKDLGEDHAPDQLQEFLDFLKGLMKAQITAEYPPEPEYISEVPDDAEMVAIDQKILEAAGQMERAILYEQYQEKLKKKGQAELDLQQNKNDQADQYGKRLEYIKAFKFPFTSLSVDDEGGLLLDDKPLKPAYFSSGELIKTVVYLMAALNPDFKYVFIQEANLLDDVNIKELEKDLTAQGFQIVFELVGREPVQDKNCIMLRNMKVVREIAPGTKSLIELSETKIEE